MKRKLMFLGIITLIILIFLNYEVVLNSTIDGVYIWLYKVFPYLFIMIIIQNILIDLNISRYFKNTALYIFVSSLISGSPTSALIIAKLVDTKAISLDYANKCLTFSFFLNPLFLYTILNSIFSFKICIKLVLILYISNFILYLYYKKDLLKCNYLSKSSSINITNYIKYSINTNLMVLGTICFYLVISNIIINTLRFDSYTGIILRGILEVTQGLNGLVGVSVKFKEALATLLITFGGLSIHTQVKCILDEYNLSYKYFLKGRILQMGIATLITIAT